MLMIGVTASDRGHRVRIILARWIPGGEGLPNVGYTGMCHQPGSICHFQKSRTGPILNFEVLLQNRPYFLKIYYRTGSFSDNLVSNAPAPMSKIPVAFLKLIGPIPIFFLKSMPIFFSKRH